LPGGERFRVFAHIVIESGRLQIFERKPLVPEGLAHADKFNRGRRFETRIAHDGNRAVIRQAALNAAPALTANRRDLMKRKDIANERPALIANATPP
jgi:hypothetical protein